mmetsp:Transcript_116021/g.183384  ORF Transcript_116021/g.183384 Transcript_116021/m.183384 type:complete len:230 (-) Transcript_116021:265-954(-)
MCGSCTSCNNKVVIVSSVAILLTYSTEARMDIAAASLASQRLSLPYCCIKASKLRPVFSNVSFLTKKSTFDSPYLLKPSSSSSCSSMSTSTQPSSSSTSAKNMKAVLRTFSTRSGTALFSTLLLDSDTVAIHSKASLRNASSMVPFAVANVSMISTHSAYLGLKKAGCSIAQETIDVRDSSNALASLAVFFKAASIMGSSGCIAWQLSESRAVIISATKFSAATCRLGA